MNLLQVCECVFAAGNRRNCTWVPQHRAQVKMLRSYSSIRSNKTWSDHSDFSAVHSIRPMDLATIKKNIETGLIRTTAEFQRDIMLMFQNAVMYNSLDHDVYHMALEMQRDVLEQIQQFLATQLIMETSESGVSAKSLRGRESTRKQDSTDKVLH